MFKDTTYRVVGIFRDKKCEKSPTPVYSDYKKLLSKIVFLLGDLPQNTELGSTTNRTFDLDVQFNLQR